MRISSKTSQGRSGERGQSFLVVAVFIVAVLLGSMGVAIDYSAIWAHRQMAQGAADAACQAAAGDMFRQYLGGTTYSWIGSTFDCSTNTSSGPCKYATFNGYSGSAVSVSFPSSLPGVSALPGVYAITNPYVQVRVTDPVPMSFTKMFGAGNNFNISATAGCGFIQVVTRIPLLVLNPTTGTNPTFNVNGTPTIKIIGGPQRSVEVDSTSATAEGFGGTIDLSLAGPAGTGGDFAVGGSGVTNPTSNLSLGTTGHFLTPATPLADPFATIAAPAIPAAAGTAFPVAFAVNGCPDPTGCIEFTPGKYTACTDASSPGKAVTAFSNACPNSANFKTTFGTDWTAGGSVVKGALIVPSAGNTNKFMFMAKTGGTSKTGAAPSWAVNVTQNVIDGTVTWTNMGPINPGSTTEIFDPGVYYMGSSGLQPTSGTTLRTSTAAGDGTGGLMFYFSKPASVSVGATGSPTSCTSITAGTTSWTPNKNGCIADYTVDGSLTLGLVPNRALMCTSASPPNPTGTNGVPATSGGNILLGPCTGPSPGQTQDYSGGLDPAGTYTGPTRGFLFFQSRSQAANGGSCTGSIGGKGQCAILGGGGSFIFSGFAYFHFLPVGGTTCGSDMSCLTLAGNSGSSSLTLGNMVVDELSLNGSSTIKMILNSYSVFPELKPSLLQ